MIALIICSYPQIITGVQEHAFYLDIRKLERETLLSLMIKHILAHIITEKTMFFCIDKNLISIVEHR